jgi:hypothetical protein
VRKTILGAATATAVVALGAVGAASANDANWLYYFSNNAQAIGRAQQDAPSNKNDNWVSNFTRSVGSLAATPTALYVESVDNNNARQVDRFDAATAARSTVITSPCSQAGQGMSFFGRIVTNGQHLFYICQAGSSAGDARFIARAGLDGTGINENFVALTGNTMLSDTFTTSGSYAFFKSTGVSQPIKRVALSPGSAVETDPGGAIAFNSGALVTNGAKLFWVTPTVNPATIGSSGLDFAGRTTLFSSGLTFSGSGDQIAASPDYFFWLPQTPGQIGRASADGSGTAQGNTFTAPSGQLKIAVPVMTSSTPAPAPTPAPIPAPAPTPTATTLATPTVNTSAPGKNAVVTVRTQLGPKGKYTFIFQRPTSNEMSRETQASGRVAMQKGTRLGKRILRKTYTAAVITTTADNARVVTRALLRKAQARKLNLRVVHTPTSGPQTESVIKIK